MHSLGEPQTPIAAALYLTLPLLVGLFLSQLWRFPDGAIIKKPRLKLFWECVRALRGSPKHYAYVFGRMYVGMWADRVLSQVLTVHGLYVHEAVSHCVM